MIAIHSKRRGAGVPSLVLHAAIAVAILAVSACTSAEEYPKAIQRAVDSGLRVVKSFPAASGLTGWVLAQGGQHTIVYTTADKKTLLAGALIGEGGESLSAGYEDKHVPKPDISALFQELDKSSYVVEGPASSPKGMIYVFIDANCPFCHYTWKALQPYEEAGLQVRWILVDTLGPTSMPKAIEVLAAPDKTAALRRMEENHGKPWTGSTRFTADAAPALAQNIRKNGELMGRFGFSGTPGIVWKDKQGEVQRKAGMPRLHEFPLITGLPEQKVDDPALARFR